MAATAAVFILGGGPGATSAAAATPTLATPATEAARTTTPVKVVPTQADKVIAIAKTKLGRPWVYGAAGPSLFDCSGLVIYSFRTAGISQVVGSRFETSAYALYARFRARGLASSTNGQRGDLVIWGGGSHVGIYLGNGMAISTLVSGVRIHAVRALTTRFTAYLHTGIGTHATASVPHPTTAKKPVARAPTVTSRRITATALRLRSSASTAARVLRTLAAGTRVGVVRVAKDGMGRTWYRVLVGGRLGWLAGWHTRAA